MNLRIIQQIQRQEKEIRTPIKRNGRAITTKSEIYYTIFEPGLENN